MEQPKPEETVLQREIDYKTLSFFLPSYDGNKKTLAFYIKSVESALDLIENKQHVSVACLIRNKLTGKAVEALSECTDFNSWDAIKEILTRRFGEFRDEVQIVQELMNVRKDKSTIESFSEKIRELTYTLINLDQTKKEYYEKMAINVFLDQLDSILALSVRVQNATSLEQTIVLAKQEDLKLKNKRAQENKTKQLAPNTNYRFQQPLQNNRFARPQPTQTFRFNQQNMNPVNRPNRFVPQLGNPRPAPQPGPANTLNKQFKPAPYAPVNFQTDLQHQSDEFQNEENIPENCDNSEELEGDVQNFYQVPEEEFLT